jgi:hypothetical protein
MGVTPAHVVKWRGRGRSGSRWPRGEREREWARAFSKYLFPFSFPRILYKVTRGYSKSDPKIIFERVVPP